MVWWGNYIKVHLANRSELGDFLGGEKDRTVPELLRTNHTGMRNSIKDRYKLPCSLVDPFCADPATTAAPSPAPTPTPTVSIFVRQYLTPDLTPV